ncbi:hypothetical protein [Mesorhizobium sp. KR9-304]|uniref:hypothetical protein n=1 Tax=Mesorhizobium sp. KR9-304 TaxID=3156614 RepID=UPI0032B416D1
MAWATSQLIFQPPLTRLFGRGFSFEIPSGWECFRERTRTDCLKVADEAENAYLVALVLTARDGSDPTAGWLEQLRLPFTKQAEGTEIKSTIVHAGTSSIDGHEWVDGTHDNMIAIGKRSRVLATTNGMHMIVIVLSCAFDSCDSVQPTFQTIVRSINVSP